MEHEELLTAREVAARLKVHVETVKTWLRSGQMRGYPLGDRSGWRVRASEVDAFLERKAAEAEGKAAA
jgi:excisionase family DNA binding protein